jgi:hypothetical protein
MGSKLSKLANGLPLTYDYIDQIVESLNGLADKLDARSGGKIPAFFSANSSKPTTKTPVVMMGQETFTMSGTGADPAKEIRFGKTFHEKPIVIATVNQLDERSGQPINAYCTVCQITGAKFKAKVFYASDTKPRNIILNYIAIGFSKN